jgi:hypothetical protein
MMRTTRMAGALLFLCGTATAQTASPAACAALRQLQVQGVALTVTKTEWFPAGTTPPAGHVIDAPAVVSARVRRGVSAADELVEKRPRLLPVNDAGERGVLAQQTHAGVQHHGHEEPCLALGETQVDDSSDAVVGRHRNNSDA